MKLQGENVGFRIMQLQYEPLSEEAKIVQGYEMWLDYNPFHRNVFGRDNCAILKSSYTPGGKRNVLFVSGYTVTDLGDGFKEVTFGISDHINEKEENAILLMIGIGAENVQTDNERKIAGRYEECILELFPNDIVKVTRGNLTEEFIAIKIDNQMYLVKKYN